MKQWKEYPMRKNPYRAGTMALIEAHGRVFGACVTHDGAWMSHEPAAPAISPDMSRVVQVLHEPAPDLGHEDVVAASEAMREHAARVTEGEVPVMDWYGMAYAALATAQ